MISSSPLRPSADRLIDDGRIQASPSRSRFFVFLAVRLEKDNTYPMLNGNSQGLFAERVFCCYAEQTNEDSEIVTSSEEENLHL